MSPFSSPLSPNAREGILPRMYPGNPTADNDPVIQFLVIPKVLILCSSAFFHFCLFFTRSGVPATQMESVVYEIYILE